MAKNTPSMAKNSMRRCLVAILDPHPSPSEIAELWSYFESSCAYCGIPLDRASRNGHLDHILPTAMGGSNDIHNHLLSCARCNGDEKREEEWASFLARKVTDTAVAAERRAHILAWIGRACSGDTLDPLVRSQSEHIIAEALSEFDVAVSKLRALRQARK